jgi:DNA-binding Lrp family transcriptional regulator
MDDLDRRLLRLLREDADRPLKALAAAVGLSTSSVRDRIVRLKASGVIRRVTVEVVLPGEVGAVLFVRLVRTPDLAAVRDITAFDEVVRCYSLSGETDLFVELVGPDTASVNSTRDRIADLPGVAAVVTALILRRDRDGGVLA